MGDIPSFVLRARIDDFVDTITNSILFLIGFGAEAGSSLCINALGLSAA